MTASLYRKYNAFSNRESAQTEQKHRTMTFVGRKADVRGIFWLYLIVEEVYKTIGIINSKDVSV